MLIRDTTWSEIRECFTEEEKVALRECVAGETICPRGFIIETDDLAPALRDKLRSEMFPV